MKNYLLTLIFLMFVSCLANEGEFNLTDKNGMFSKGNYESLTVEASGFKYPNSERKVADINLFLSEKETITIQILNIQKIDTDIATSFDNPNITITYQNNSENEVSIGGYVFIEKMDAIKDDIAGNFNLIFSKGEIKGNFNINKINWQDGVAMGDIPPDPSLIALLNKKEEGQTSFIFKADPGAFTPQATFVIRDRESKEEIKEGLADENGGAYIDITSSATPTSSTGNIEVQNLEVKQGNSNFVKVTTGQLMFQ